ncbi:GNAT family N-acetyltransferase [Jatrophihabitans sp. YIM 134969]
MGATVTLQRLTADDWRVYREVRFAALTDAPRMFGSDLAREQAFDPAAWRQRAAGTTVAYANDQLVGVVGWHWVDEPRTADLVAMWVSPAGRGLGVGAALVRDVVDQVVTTRGADLELGVLVDNDVATALYVREGFVDIGREVGIRSGDLLRRMRYAPGGAGEQATA